QDMTVTYDYDRGQQYDGIGQIRPADRKGTGRMTEAYGEGEFKGNDSFDNLTSGTIVQEYDPALIEQFGKALLTKSVTHSRTDNLDLSWQEQDMTVTYTYDRGAQYDGIDNIRPADRKGTGRLKEAYGEGEFKGNDGFDNLTSGMITQLYDPKLIEQFGKALLTQSVTHSRTDNVDGSWQEQDMTVTYTYDDGNQFSGSRPPDYKPTGRLFGATGSGTFTSDDGNGNLTTGTITQEYASELIVTFGKALLTKSITKSETVNLDGSIQIQEMTVVFGYDQTGQVASAFGSGTTKTTDIYSNITQGTVTQTYIKVNGQMKLSSVTTVTDDYRRDASGNLVLGDMNGSTSHTEMTVYYAYNELGQMVADGGVYGGKQNADGTWDRRTFGEGTFRSDDRPVFTGESKGSVSEGTIVQTYEIINGQARLSSSTSISKSWEDPSKIAEYSTSTTTTYYAYDAQGQLVLSGGVFGNEKTYGMGTSTSTKDGKTTTTTTLQEYVLINGKALIKSSTSVSKTHDEPDSTMTVTYQYDTRGLLTHVSGSGRQGDVTITQEYFNPVTEKYGKAILKHVNADGPTPPMPAGCDGMTASACGDLYYGKAVEEWMAANPGQGVTAELEQYARSKAEWAYNSAAAAGAFVPGVLINGVWTNLDQYADMGGSAYVPGVTSAVVTALYQNIVSGGTFNGFTMVNGVGVANVISVTGQAIAITAVNTAKLLNSVGINPATVTGVAATAVMVTITEADKTSTITQVTLAIGDASVRMDISKEGGKTKIEVVAATGKDALAFAQAFGAADVFVNAGALAGIEAPTGGEGSGSGMPETIRMDIDVVGGRLKIGGITVLGADNIQRMATALGNNGSISGAALSSLSEKASGSFGVENGRATTLSIYDSVPGMPLDTVPVAVYSMKTGAQIGGTTYQRDAQGNVTSAETTIKYENGAAETYTRTFTYDAEGNITGASGKGQVSTRDGNFTVTEEYNVFSTGDGAKLRLTRARQSGVITSTEGAVVSRYSYVSNTEYVYDEEGNLTNVQSSSSQELLGMGMMVDGVWQEIQFETATVGNAAQVKNNKTLRALAEAYVIKSMGSSGEDLPDNVLERKVDRLMNDWAKAYVGGTITNTIAGGKIIGSKFTTKAGNSVFTGYTTVEGVPQMVDGWGAVMSANNVQDSAFKGFLRNLAAMGAFGFGTPVLTALLNGDVNLAPVGANKIGIVNGEVTVYGAGYSFTVNLVRPSEGRPFDLVFGQNSAFSAAVGAQFTDADMKMFADLRVGLYTERAAPPTARAALLPEADLPKGSEVTYAVDLQALLRVVRGDVTLRGPESGSVNLSEFAGRPLTVQMGRIVLQEGGITLSFKSFGADVFVADPTASGTLSEKQNTDGIKFLETFGIDKIKLKGTSLTLKDVLLAKGSLDGYRDGTVPLGAEDRVSLKMFLGAKVSASADGVQISGVDIFGNQVFASTVKGSDGRTRMVYAQVGRSDQGTPVLLRSNVPKSTAPVSASAKPAAARPAASTSLGVQVQNMSSVSSLLFVMEDNKLTF
ncbi:MAG: hypothetical protein HY548_06500, partial [Elusimicrobia bacterium]|nr:hypothetical protein [Elusimicrobiota bacterium]